MGSRIVEEIVCCVCLLGGLRFVTGGKGGVVFWRVHAGNIDRETVVDIDGVVTSSAFWVLENAQTFLHKQNNSYELVVGL